MTKKFGDTFLLQPVGEMFSEVTQQPEQTVFD